MNESDLSFYVGVGIGCLCVLAGYVTDQRRAVQLFTAEVLRIKEAPHGTDAE